MFLGYLLALLAAAANATSNVLQRKANRAEPAELSMSPRLILDLLHRPAWLGGLVTVVLSFLLMAAALSHGRLAAVQPIVVLELPLTLIAGAKVFKSELHWREWGAAALMTGGLIALIAMLDPTGGNRGQAPGVDWAVATAVNVGAIAVLLLAGLRSEDARRAAFLGVATGLAFGLTAAFMKGMTGSFHGGILAVVTTWQTYAMAASGLAGMFLMQNALQAGRLIAAQPGITLADPAVAILWGLIVFHEHHRGGLYLAVAVAAAGMMGVATVILARSPLLEGAAGAEEQEETGAEPSPAAAAS
ncbi:MAG TPA: DMT family transporter [Acidimicrobiales bacterium]|nr:DMT family transporter [Acidimicrobiales bacterium]